MVVSSRERSLAELIVDMHEFCFAYSEDRKVLKDVDLEVRPKERLALIGSNGAGKSTLLLTLTGFLKGEGKINLFGEPLNKKSVKAARQRMGLLFDDPEDQLFMPTVEEDVAFGPLNMGLAADEVDGRVAKALNLVGMSGFEKTLTYQLSKGQKKLAALASILSMKPELLLLDEPSAFLDPLGKARLLKILKSLDAAQIIATHDLEFAQKLCEKTAVIRSGTILESGLTDEVMKNSSLLKEAGLVE